MGAEAAEICTTFLLSCIKDALPTVNAGCYRDDGLLVTKARPQQVEQQKKKLCDMFSRHGLSIEASVKSKVTDFLDVVFDLSKNQFSPYKKPGDNLVYVDGKSDHPKKILKNVPVSVEKRLSGISSSREVFMEAALPYQTALNLANHDHILEYQEDVHDNNNDDENNNNNENRKQKRKRNRNLTYFTPPFSNTVRTKIGQEFLKIIDTAFPQGNPLHKKLNRHNMKVSYSCMPNMKTQISRHNAQRLAADRVQQEAEPRCNCTQFPCPIPGGNQCRSKNAVYQATIKVEPRPEVEEEVEEVHTYVGASHDFKERYYRHRTSFNNPTYRTDTTLSKCVWKLKEDNRQFTIKWRIIDRGAAYRPSSKRCNLCLKEKYWIIFHPEMASLNDNSEIWTPCMHRHSTFLKKA